MFSKCPVELSKNDELKGDKLNGSDCSVRYEKCLIN